MQLLAGPKAADALSQPLKEAASKPVLGAGVQHASRTRRSSKNSDMHRATPDHLANSSSLASLPALTTETQLHSVAQQSRRSIALGGLSLASLLFLPTSPARAFLLKSQRSDRPCALTVQNNGLHTIKLFWINYDGEAQIAILYVPRALSHAWTWTYMLLVHMLQI